MPSFHQPRLERAPPKSRPPLAGLSAQLRESILTKVPNSSGQPGRVRVIAVVGPMIARECRTVSPKKNERDEYSRSKPQRSSSRRRSRACKHALVCANGSLVATRSHSRYPECTRRSPEHATRLGRATNDEVDPDQATVDPLSSPFRRLSGPSGSGAGRGYRQTGGHRSYRKYWLVSRLLAPGTCEVDNGWVPLPCAA